MVDVIASATRPRRGSPLAEMLAAASSRQIAAAAFATGISAAKLERYAQGRGLDAVELQKVAEFFLRGAYFIKTARRNLGPGRRT
jgi:hypothetical protein